MKAFAINAPTPEMQEASFHDRTANIIRVTYNTGLALLWGAVAISGLHVDLWFAVVAGAAGAIGGLLFFVSLLASYDFARGPGWGIAALTLPSSKFTLAISQIVVTAIFGVMMFVGDKLGLSVRQWGLLGLCSGLVTNQLSGLCLFYLRWRKGDA